MKKAVLLCLFFLVSSDGLAKIPDGLSFSSDFRFRMEADYNSRESDGSKRNDRDRVRLRLRTGFAYQYSENIKFSGRARTGNRNDQQSSHQTLGNEFEPKTVSVDKAFVEGKFRHLEFWLGKNSMPFWRQNGFYWDSDVNPEGITLWKSYDLADGSWKIRPVIGYYIVESLGRKLEDNADVLAYQLGSSGSLGNVKLNLASGMIRLSKVPDAPNEARATTLDYALWVSSVKFAFPVREVPLALGFDYMKNMEDYDSSIALHDKKTGMVASLKLGGVSSSGDWLLGYYYARIEKFAVVPYFAQDNWMRWGFGSTGTRSANFKGHEFRLGYGLGKKSNLIFKVCLVEASDKDGTHIENGNRMRLDYNIGF